MLAPLPLPGIPLWGILFLCGVGLIMPVFWLIGLVAAVTSGRSTIGGLFRLARKDNRPRQEEYSPLYISTEDDLSRIEKYV